MWSAPAGKRQIVGRSVAAHAHSSRRTTLLSIGSVLLACTGPARAADQTDASSPNVGQLEAFSDNIAQLEVRADSAPPTPTSHGMPSLTICCMVQR